MLDVANMESAGNLIQVKTPLAPLSDTFGRIQV
jgi:hypothetical protein